MEIRDIIFSIVMVIASSVLTYRWLTRFGNSDLIIILAAMILIAALAALILSIDMRLRKMEDTIESKERSLRISIQGIEDSTNKSLNTLSKKMDDVMDEFTKRIYR